MQGMAAERGLAAILVADVVGSGNRPSRGSRELPSDEHATGDSAIDHEPGSAHRPSRHAGGPGKCLSLFVPASGAKLAHLDVAKRTGLFRRRPHPASGPIRTGTRQRGMVRRTGHRRLTVQTRGTIEGRYPGNSPMSFDRHGAQARIRGRELLGLPIPAPALPPPQTPDQALEFIFLAAVIPGQGCRISMPARRAPRPLIPSHTVAKMEEFSR